MTMNEIANRADVLDSATKATIDWMREENIQSIPLVLLLNLVDTNLINASQEPLSDAEGSWETEFVINNAAYINRTQETQKAQQVSA